MKDTALGIVTAIVGVAILAVIVGRQSKTGEVIRESASGFAKVLGVAISPVTGSGNGYVAPY
jgi:hypothetical protein